MRYRLLASYQGAPYEAGIGPDDAGVVLFAACPPPEDLHFEPATGHWRKKVSRTDVQMLYESRPVGTFRGERCVVLDDLNDRLHIAYLGHDAYRAEQLGYWEVDRGVFELITPRQEVSEIVEQRLPLALRGEGDAHSVPASGAPGLPIGHEPQAANGAGPGGLGGLFWPAGQGAAEPELPGAPYQSRVSIPAVDEPPLPLEAEAMRAATAAARRGKKGQPKHGAASSPAIPPIGAGSPGEPPGAAGAAAGSMAGSASRPAGGLSSAPSAGLAGPVSAPASAAAPIPVTPAGLSEPSGAVNHGGDTTSAVPSWTPHPHVPPPRHSPAADPLAPPSPARDASPVQAPPPAQSLSQPAAPAQAPAASQPQTAAHAQPSSHAQPSPRADAPSPAQAPAPPQAQAAPLAQAASVIENSPVHGVPLPMPAEPAMRSPQSPPAQHRAQQPASADQTGSGQPSMPPRGEPDKSEPGGTVNGVAHDGRSAARALLESAHPATYMLDQLELPLPTTADAAASVRAALSPGSPDQLRRNERPLAPEAALTARPPAGPDTQSAPAAVAAPAPAAAEADAQPTPRRRRASRRRLPTQRIFSELAAQAGIPATAYAIGEDIEGAMCLVSTGDGFEVFNSLAGARHEVRLFQDEESAYFYLFGVLAAEAVRTGVLAPRQ